MIYANHAGTSWPKPPGVAEAVQRALVGDPTANAALYRDAHAEIAAFFGIGSPERLMLTPSCTAALAVVIADLPWRDGDVVVTSHLEHHALSGQVQRLAARGVRHEVAPYRPGAPLDLDAVEAVLRRGRVRLVAVTGASNVTGELLPIAELAQLAHRHGALLLLDAAQVAGLRPVRAADVDLLVFAGHKGMLGPLGIGGFWAAPGVEFGCPGATCEVGPGAAPRAPFPGFCDTGSVNLPAAAGLAAALRWLAARGDADRQRPLQLARRLLDGCRSRAHCRVLGGDGDRTATVSLLVEGLPLDRAQAWFRDRDIVVRAGQHCAPMALLALSCPEGCLRISFGPTSREDDVDAILAAIDAAAGIG